MYFLAKKQAEWALFELVIYFTCKLGYVEQLKRRQLIKAPSVLAAAFYSLFEAII